MKHIFDKAKITIEYGRAKEVIVVERTIDFSTVVGAPD